MKVYKMLKPGSFKHLRELVGKEREKSQRATEDGNPSIGEVGLWSCPGNGVCTAKGVFRGGQ